MNKFEEIYLNLIAEASDQYRSEEIVSPADDEIKSTEKMVGERNKEDNVQTMRKNIEDDLSSLKFASKFIEIGSDGKIKVDQDFVNGILENLAPALEVLTDEEKTQFENLKSLLAQS